MLPTQILDEFCTANTIPLPSYAEDGSNCVINDEMYTITEFGMLLSYCIKQSLSGLLNISKGPIPISA